jgi:hypothetical protein
MSQPDPTTITKGYLRPCCADSANLDRSERLAADLVVRYCRVCGRRHFEADAAPGQLGVEMT